MKHNINKPINIKEIELIILELSKSKSLGPDDFIDKFYQILKELTQYLQENARGRNISHFMKLVLF